MPHPPHALNFEGFFAPAQEHPPTHQSTRLANASGPGNPFARPLNIKHMLRNVPPPLDFVLPGLLAGTVGLMVGPGGVSKTMLALQIAVAMATGTSLLGELVGESKEPARVVLVLAEEDVHIVWHRLYAVAKVQLESIGINLRDAYERMERNLVIHALGGGQQVNLLGRDHERTQAGDQLRSACTGARLVVLDPLRNFHNADENDSTAMNALIRHIAGYAASTGAAWLLTHHSSRAASLNDYGTTADAGRGSTAVTNTARWQLNLSRPSETSAKLYRLSAHQMDDCVLLSVPKVNYDKPARTIALTRGDHGVLSLMRSRT